MNYLVDGNVMTAWGWSDPPHHDRVDRWIQSILVNSNACLLTSPIVELGFVRVSVQKSCRNFPSWCTNHKRTTHSHLLALAQKHKLHLATLDTSIPAAYIIPE